MASVYMRRGTWYANFKDPTGRRVSECGAVAAANAGCQRLRTGVRFTARGPRVAGAC